MSPRQSRPRRPLGIYVLAFLQILSGFQLLVSSLFYLALSSWAKTPEGLAELSRSGKEWIVENAGGVFFVLAVVSLVLGVGALWLARGYVKGFEWARRRGRMVAVLAILFAVFGAIFLPARIDAGSPFWTIVFNVVVIAYLGSANVRAYFRQGG